MLSNEQVQLLVSENEWLQIQLKDVNELIAVREEELDLLRKTAMEAASLKSSLDMNLHELHQMQDHIGKYEQKAAGAAKREAALEEEMFQSIALEKEYYNIRDKFASNQAALADINQEVAEAVSVYKQLADLKAKNAELTSNLEIAIMENGFMKEELEKLRQENLTPKDMNN